MSQHGKRKAKSLLDFYTSQKIESFLAYFMRILNSCVVCRDSILHTGASQASAHFLCSTARIRQDISAVSFCSCKLRWRSDERVLLPCFNAKPDIFAVMNCCVVTLSLFSTDILTSSADVYKIRGVHIEEYAYYVNKFRQNVGLETWIWRQIVTSKTAHTNTNDHHMPLMETTPWKISAHVTDIATGQISHKRHKLHANLLHLLRKFLTFFLMCNVYIFQLHLNSQLLLRQIAVIQVNKIKFCAVAHMCQLCNRKDAIMYRMRTYFTSFSIPLWRKFASPSFNIAFHLQLETFTTVNMDELSFSDWWIKVALARHTTTKWSIIRPLNVRDMEKGQTRWVRNKITRILFMEHVLDTTEEMLPKFKQVLHNFRNDVKILYRDCKICWKYIFWSIFVVIISEITQNFTLPS